MRKLRRRRKKSAKYINVPFFIVILFLCCVSLLSIKSIYVLGNSRVKADIYSSTIDNSKGILASKTKKASHFFSWFPFEINSSGENKPVPTVTPKSKVPAIVPAVQANEKTVNDFCLNVPVLFYHHIEPLAIAQQSGHAQLTVDSDYFDKQMAYLNASGYRSLSADELVDALINHRGLPFKSIVVTFDDGYDDNYKYAFQSLKKYNISGSFMIPTGLVENNGYMTWNQLREIAGNSLMHIYNHTWSHASLGGAGKDEIEFEIKTANKQIEDNLGKRVSIFTYPYGSFSQEVVGVLRENGFRAAFSTINGTMQCESYIFQLRRINIGNAPLSSYGL